MTVTHALEPDTQGQPRTLEIALCGGYIRIQDNAGHQATCPACQAVLTRYAELEP